MSQKKQKLFLIRHGETEWNSAFRFQGQTDVPLGDTGRRQARLLAERLKTINFDNIYSSPLSRALETASIIKERASRVSSIVRSDGLSEMCFGNWEGLTLAEVQKNDPARFLSWREDPSSVSPPGGESFDDLVSRAENALNSILLDEPGNVLIVCHGGTIRAVLVALVGIPPAAVWKVRVDNCSLTAIDLNPERAMLRFSNDTAHLRVDASLAGEIPIL